MSPELEDALRLRHPRIFPPSYRDEADSAMSRGFECGDGWYTLIDALCVALQREVDNGDGVQPIATQVKQKFGTLRFHARPTSNSQRAQIRFAGILSARLCEICSAQFDITCSTWSNALCGHHHRV